MTKPPKISARQQRIDGLHPMQRPGNEHAQYFDDEASRGQVPDDDGREHAVNGKRSRGVAMLTSPGAVAGNHYSSPNPRANDQTRCANVKQRMRLQRRIEGVEHGALSAQNRNSSGN